MNTDKHRLKKIGLRLSALIYIYLWLKIIDAIVAKIESKGAKT